MLATTALSLLALSACAPAADAPEYDSVRQECGLTPDSVLSHPKLDDAPAPCDEALLRAFRVEAGTDSTGLEGLTAALRLLLGADLGTHAAAMRDEAIDPFWRSVLSDYGTDAHRPFGETLFRFVLDNTDQLVLSNEVGHAGARSEGPVILLDRATFAEREPVLLAGIIVHEAAHRMSPDHIQCLDDESWECAGDLLDCSYQCDQTPGGSYGLEASFHLLWLERLTGGTPDELVELCATAAANRQCHYIQQADQFAPCLIEQTTLCEALYAD